ncbi:hypothetical protein BKP35_10790 [Anaerobacillus arseniciselenatis]|uniref:Lipoprotein SmpA/OmlA domain-containing protein n=1 Tax=Anaerobacillus arseniciselenatis TaxID=85682 RepID=A0A1S2LIZ4_9BACI|nr:hypothetical protein [Anaerobacillus arseniciselenatis]OIJ12284.1 hypothetical protein BKP35_10790 [Anaerobacillus arseniciselenatis]
MKKLLLLLLLSLVLAFSSACTQTDTNEPENDADQKEQMNEEIGEKEKTQDESEENNISKEEPVTEDTEKSDEKETNEEQQTGDVTEGEKEEPTEEQYRSNVDTLKEKEIVGKELNDVELLLGRPTVEAKDAILHVWRYDYPSEGYFFDNQLNAVDVEGLYNEQMEAQLMVFFENDIATSYSIYYLKEDEIMHYLETEHGSEEYSASRD